MNINNQLLLGTSNTSNLSWLSYWNYTTGNVEHMHRSKCRALRNSMHQLGNDYVLVAEEAKPMLHIWPINSQEETKERYVIPGIATALCVDPMSKYLVIGIGPKVYIWNICSGALLNIIQKHYQPVTVIKMTNFLEFIIVGGKDGMLVTYRLNDAVSLIRSKECQPLYTKNDHTGPITDIAVGVFGDKSNIASVSEDFTCRIYTVQTGVPLVVLIFNDMLMCTLFDITSRNIFVGESNGTIRNIFLQNSQSLTQHVDTESPCFRGHTGSISCLTLNSNNEILASASTDSTIIVWSVESREQIHKIKLEIPASCLLFVNNHVNIREKNLSPVIMLRPLQKAIVEDPGDVEVSIMQTDDIWLSDDSESGSDDENNFKDVRYEVREDRGEMAREVAVLRTANKKLFETILNMSRKYNA